jgi:hypothetical protein
MSADRIVGLGGLTLGLLLIVLAGDTEAYLFPRSIAVAMAVLGLAIFASTLRPHSRSTTIADKARISWPRVVPVLAVLVVYRWAMEVIGFYSAGFAAFLAIAWIYGPEPFSVGTAIKRIAISAAFMAAIFAVFFLLLRVQTPRGVLL